MTTIINNQNIKNLVNNYIDNKSLLPQDLRNIPIGQWDVSRVTDMSDLFYQKRTFNEALNWDVSNVTNMRSMFHDAESFNSPLTFNGGPWNVSNVIYMNLMFYQAINFNQDIGDWDVSNVNDMAGMFFYAQNFNRDLSRWNVKNVKSMYCMFKNAIRFVINPKWTVNPKTNIEEIFRDTSISGETLNIAARARPQLISNPSAEAAARSEYDHPSLRPVTSSAATTVTTKITKTNIKKLVQFYMTDKNSLPEDLKNIPIRDVHSF